jgi:DNA-binding response OmpR family regulator
VAYFGEYIFDAATKVLKNKDNVINLTSTEITIIEFLVKNINIEVSREEIAKTLGESINLRSIDVTITRLRKKLIASNNDSILRTIRGKGYMLVSEYE